MNLVKCENGHYYDGDKYRLCPHCAVPGEIDKTVSGTITEESPAQPPKESNPDGEILLPDLSDDDRTVGYYETKINNDPVVGWLVCVEGSQFGKSFTLKTGKNFIGRNPGVNDVVLQGDQSISREKHAILVYDPKSRNFIVQPGMSHELFYLNDDVVLQSMVIKQNDFISIGNMKLMFIQCCGPDFSWDDYTKQQEEKEI